MKKWFVVAGLFMGVALNTSVANAGIVLDAGTATVETSGVDAIAVELQKADRAVDQGDFTSATTLLQLALSRVVVSNPADIGNYAAVVERIVRLNKRQGQQAATVELLQNAHKSLSENNPSLFSALLLNDIGKAQSDSGDNMAAVSSFSVALSQAKITEHPLLQVRIQNNYFRSLVDSGQYSRAEDVGHRLVANIVKLPSSPEKRALALSTGFQLANGQSYGQMSPSLRLETFDLVKSTMAATEIKNDPALLSLAFGTIGFLYEQEKRYEESAHFTRRALFQAQAVNESDLVFRWQWQLGRTLRLQNRNDSALLAYGQAFDSLQRIRHQLLLDRSDSFTKIISPIYSEYLDVFTRKIRAIADPVEKQQALESLRLAIEQLKVAEIEDYYQNACFDEANPTSNGTLHDDASVAIYPVILDDRVELLLKRRDGLALYSHAINRDEVVKAIQGFRASISEYDLNADYLGLGNKLYKIFVAPYETDLREKDTLIFVAAWMLRTVPMAALYDGQRFLIEKYALVTTPSMLLTNTESLSRQKVRVLANGITDAVQGYDALPSVNQELDSIASLYNAVVLKNQDFSVQRAQTEIGQGSYGIIHVATHGEFDSDFRKSYVLGYDNKITLAALEKTILARRFAEKPIDLLVLSACQTATGDDRAALGLAGVAVKAGARSALATLWFISDEATSQLISQFYQQLQIPNVSKAEALRKAQVSLISTDRYKHPNLWAPFILIGNWL